VIIQEQFDVGAPRQAVWDFLLDPEKVAPCMAGVEAVKPLGNDSFQVRGSTRVGPIKVAGEATLTVVEKHPPERFRITGEGKDQITGSKLRGSADVELLDSGNGAVTCRLKVDVAIMGALDKYGHGVANRKAAEIREAFSACVRSKLETAHAVAPVPAPVPAPSAPRGPLPWWRRLWRRLQSAIRSLFRQ
jgi:uncharacterized protein